MFRLRNKQIGSSFHIEFENGYTLSLFMGDTAYDNSVTTGDKFSYTISSPNIECAVLDKEGNFVRTPFNQDESEDDVIGHMTSAQVLELMNWTAAL